MTTIVKTVPLKNKKTCAHKPTQYKGLVAQRGHEDKKEECPPFAGHVVTLVTLM